LPDAAFPVPEAPVQLSQSSHLHSVQFYETEEFLSHAVGRFLHEGLSRNAPVLVIARAPQRQAFTDYLMACGWNCDQLRRDGQFTLLDAEETLEMFMVDGMPDERLFTGYVGNLVAQIAEISRQHPVQAYGDMVNVLWRRGEQRAALRLEELWNDLILRYSFDLLCAYALTGFVSGDQQLLMDVCERHTNVAHSESRASQMANVSSLEIQVIKQRIRELEQELAQLRRD
jgi:hypothetical protein